MRKAAGAEQPLLSFNPTRAYTPAKRARAGDLSPEPVDRSLRQYPQHENGTDYVPERQRQVTEKRVSQASRAWRKALTWAYGVFESKDY